MKKLVSMLLAVLIITATIAVGIVSASAADPAQTVVKVKKGDKVSYALSLSDASEKVVGCDFSVYYDSSVFTLDSVGDFNGSTNEDDWVATINPELDGEVIGNWSILKGIDFSSKRNIVSLNLTANKDSEAHLSYYIRFLYGDSAFTGDTAGAQLQNYNFSCDVSVNGSPVIEDAAPELNVDEPQTSGKFVNTVTGKAKDADVNLPNGQTGSAKSGSSGSKDSGSNSKSGTTAGGATNAASSKTTATNADGTPATDAATGEGNVPGEKKSSVIAATDAQGNTIEPVEEGVTTVGATDEGTGSENNSKLIMWIIIAAIVVLAGGGAAFFAIKNKKAQK